MTDKLTERGRKVARLADLTPDMQRVVLALIDADSRRQCRRCLRTVAYRQTRDEAGQVMDSEGGIQFDDGFICDACLGEPSYRMTTKPEAVPASPSKRMGTASDKEQSK